MIFFWFLLMITNTEENMPWFQHWVDKYIKWWQRKFYQFPWEFPQFSINHLNKKNNVPSNFRATRSWKIMKSCFWSWIVSPRVIADVPQPWLLSPCFLNCYYFQEVANLRIRDETKWDPGRHFFVFFHFLKVNWLLLHDWKQRCSAS